MARLPPFTLRARLLLLVLLAVVPALGLAVYTGLEQRRTAAAHAGQEALRGSNRPPVGGFSESELVQNTFFLIA
jgi:hypothetical protein